MKSNSNKSSIPVDVREEALRTIEQFNEKELAGTDSRYIPRFRGKYLYLDREDSGEIGHIGRLLYQGPKRGWHFAVYRYSCERYDDDALFPGDDLLDGTVEGALKAGMKAYD